jgi:hypothetical protein
MAIMNNPNLVGALPSQMGLLTDTVSVNFQGNGITGAIPSEVAEMSSMRWLYLNDNNLNSTIPAELSRMSRLAYLWLQGNALSGSLDPDLFANKGFRQLQELMVHNNAISGSLPDTMHMPRLRLLSVANNQLTGTIPASLAKSTELRILNFHENPGLTGNVPEELCDLMLNGKLTTITIDCDLITCNCDCICITPDGAHPNNQVQTTSDTTSPSPVNEDSGVNRPPLIDGPVEAPTPSPTKHLVNTGFVTRGTSSPQSDIEEASANIDATALPSVENEELGYYSPNEETVDVVTAAADFMLVLPDFTKEALLVEDSPQSRALDWMQADANLGSYSLRRKMQRFALATIFFSTNGMDSWHDRDYWLDFETNLHECEWFQSKPNANQSVCERSEIDDELIMTDLLLWGNGLEGDIPPEIR